MVPSSQSDISVPYAPVTSIDSADTAPELVSQPGVVPDVSVAHSPELVDLSMGSSFWTQMIRTASDWEAALIVILFLLIATLVGIRLTDAISDREMTVPTQALVPTDRSETVSEDDSPGTEHDDSASYGNVVSAETPPELLSDEGQVVRLLVENHGRIRQHQIAEETGWSKSKVSRTLSKMHDSGTIEKTSLGRENVITLSREDLNENNQSDNVGNPVA